MRCDTFCCYGLARAITKTKKTSSNWIKMIISLPRPIDSLIVSRYMYNFSLLSMLMKTIKINKQDDDYDNYDVFNVPLHFIIMSPPLRRILELFDKSTVLIITCSLALKLNWLSLSWLPDAERCVATFWATWYRHSLFSSDFHHFPTNLIV